MQQAHDRRARGARQSMRMIRAGVVRALLFQPAMLLMLSRRHCYAISRPSSDATIHVADILRLLPMAAAQTLIFILFAPDERAMLRVAVRCWFDDSRCSAPRVREEENADEPSENANHFREE